MNFPLLLGYAAVPYLVTLAISAALSAAAYFLMRPKSAGSPHGNTKAEDFNLSNLSTQGAFIPRLIGRRRVGAVVAWIGDRAVVTGNTYTPGDSKGGTRGHSRKNFPSAVTVYAERAWHLLCVGPATHLHRIWSEGRLIYDTTVNSVTTPSGSFLTTTTGELFAIYWGEDDQPVNTFLGDADRVGIESAWPSVCYVVWFGKQLGPTPHWPQIEYDVEVNLNGGDPAVASGGVFHIDATVAASVEESAANPAEDADDVATWIDQTASSWDVAGAAGNRPAYRSPLGINGQPAVDFDSAASDGMSFNTGAVHGARLAGEAWAVVYLEALPAAGLRGAVLACSQSNVNGRYIAFGVDENGAVTISFASFSPTADDRVKTPDGLVQAGAASLIRWSSNGSRWQVEVDGELQTLTVVAGSNSGAWFGDVPGGFRVSVGALFQNITSNHINGRVGEVVLYDAELSDDERVAQRLYFADKWGVTVGTFDGAFARTVGALLFESYPHGAGFDEDEFDIDSLNEASTALEDEGLDDFSVLAIEGEEVGNAIGTLLQDTGVLWTKDYLNEDAQESFVLVRDEDDPLPTIPADVVLPSETEIEVLHVERAIDRAIFSFSDVERNFRETVIAIDDDGQPLATGNVRGTVLRIGTVVDFAAAAIVAERRSQEELAGGARFTVYAGRDARLLKPGQAIRVYGIPFVLRVAEVLCDVLTSKVQLDCVLDHYGAPETSFTQPDDSTGGSPGGTAAAENLRRTWIEIPEHVAGPGDVQVAGLRLRAHDEITSQNVHLSGDGSTYKEVGIDTAGMTGGVLTSGILATDPYVIAQSATFDLEGPDADVAQDLSGDDAAWQRGDQLCLIGEELFFLQGITALGGDSYRLDGLIRARYDTNRAAHAIGDAVFIFPAGGLVPFADALAFPGLTLHMKQQPVAADELALGSVTDVSKTVYGKCVVPPPPVGLRVTAPALGVAAYHTGEDVEFRWDSRLASPVLTGAGLQPAGTAVVGVIGETDFEIRIYDPSDVLVRTEIRSTPLFTYFNADLLSDLGGETDFRVEVREVRGFASDPVELEVVAL